MRFVVQADVGPIPESEVERLNPYIIDHTVLQRMSDEDAGEEVSDKQ